MLTLINALVDSSNVVRRMSITLSVFCKYHFWKMNQKSKLGTDNNGDQRNGTGEHNGAYGAMSPTWA